MHATDRHVTEARDIRDELGWLNVGADNALMQVVVANMRLARLVEALAAEIHELKENHARN